MAARVRGGVTIIGAGFSGICMAIKLRRAGVPFTILEKGDRVGGVWRDNTYPGAACDIPSHLYSFSFEPSHDWSRYWRTWRCKPVISRTWSVGRRSCSSWKGKMEPSGVTSGRSA